MGKILVAEDDKFQQMALVAVLKSKGHQVITSDDGNDAVAKYNSNKPFDLILLDLQMPNKDGFGAAVDILKLGCQCKIFGLSADVDDNNLEKCMDVGMYSLLKKPLNIENIKNYL